MRCPCNPSVNYKACCAKVHKNISKALTPEMLMRSRFSAFVLGNVSYLMKSWNTDTRPINEEADIVAWSKSVQWSHLEIIHAGEEVVEFIAHYAENGIKQTIHEKSLFKKENGHWTYLKAL